METSPVIDLDKYKHLSWADSKDLPPKSYGCGYCGNTVGPNKGYRQGSVGGPNAPIIYICSFCTRPTYFEEEQQVPGLPYGHTVNHVPAEVSELYEEARKSTSVSAHTCAVMACRKILMNVAVTEKAAEGKTFAEYVDYLCDNGLVPAKGRVWATRIRNKGNDANHKIEQMTRPDAEELIRFIEMLLKVNYEFPAITATPASGTP